MPAVMSEREPHCLLPTAIAFRDYVTPLAKKYGLIDLGWFDMTLARALQSRVTVNDDAMHHYSWTFRMLTQKIMNILCNDYYIGTQQNDNNSKDINYDFRWGGENSL